MKRGIGWLLVFLFMLPFALGQGFIRGDSDGNGILELTDAIRILRYLFQGGAAPACQDYADVDDNGRVDITDPVYLLQHLFRGGPPPVEPYPELGYDGTRDSFTCGEADDITLSEELGFLDTPESTLLIGDQTVSILITKELFGLYRSASVSLKEVSSGKTTLLYISVSPLDSRGFSFFGEELRVMISPDDVVDGGVYDLIFEGESFNGKDIHRQSRVTVRKISSILPVLLLAGDEKKEFLPLAGSTDEQPAPPTPFCRALNLSQYSCKDKTKKILDEKNAETKYTVGWLIDNLGPSFFHEKTGEKLKFNVPEEILQDKKTYFEYPSCFLMAGFVEASSEDDVARCAEGQEAQFTVTQEVDVGTIYSCIYGYGGTSYNVITALGKIPQDAPKAHCFEHPDEVQKCVYHNEDPEKNYGHSLPYAGDDYHQELVDAERFEAENEKGEKYPVIFFTATKRHVATEGGKRFLVYWADSPNDLAPIKKNDDWKTFKASVVGEDGTEKDYPVKKAGRKSRFHSYLLSAGSCTADGQKGPDTGQHVCYTIESDLAYGSVPGDKGWDVKGPTVVDCKFS